METPTLGTITFGDRVISDLNADELAVFRRRHCGFVFQQIYLIDGMSVMDNVLAAGLLVNKDRKALAGRAPEILFADEPTGALNSRTGLHVLDTLTEFNRQGQSVVMVTHDMRSARRGNRILYLKDGVILGECDLGKYVHGDARRHEKLSAFLTEMGW